MTQRRPLAKVVEPLLKLSLNNDSRLLLPLILRLWLSKWAQKKQLTLQGRPQKQFPMHHASRKQGAQFLTRYHKISGDKPETESPPGDAKLPNKDVHDASRSNHPATPLNAELETEHVLGDAKTTNDNFHDASKSDLPTTALNAEHAPTTDCTNGISGGTYP
ncbi:hypothetical protein N7507_006589 [Penicillium longicatenatum]|nr:hypothetical protein N7507_006589 [Penicillium longicatenatum]